MNIALFQGLPDCHYDQIGYAIEYVLQCKPTSTIKVFVHYNHHSQDYIKFFRNLFGDRFIVKHIGEYNGNDFDCTFLITDDDRYFPHNISMKNVIVINHHYFVRKHNGIHFINTRNMPTPFPWALTLFRYTNLDSKLKHIADIDSIVITCLGLSGSTSTDVYLMLLNKFPRLKINVVGRHANCPETDRLKCYRNVPVEDVYKVCLKSTHILCCNNAKEFDKVMSGAVPVALSTGCQLILPGNSNYAFKSQILYNDLCTLDLPSLEEFKSKDIVKVFEDQNEMIDHRNKVFDEAIDNIMGM